MAAGDCQVEMRDEKGEVAGNLTIKNGKKVNIGGNTTLNCKDGNVTATETNPTKRAAKHPVFVVEWVESGHYCPITSSETEA